MVYFEQEELIAALESVTSEATDALLLSHNIEHLMPVVSYNESPIQRRRLSRDTTPDVQAQSPIIALTFSRKPYDGTLGFVFGSDEENCDVLLSKTMVGNGISRKHFRIDFNWESGSLLLIDQSSHGTVVDSEVTGKHTLRKIFVPIFNRDSIQAGLVRLRLKIPSHEAYQEAYDRNWQLYKKEHQEAIPINSFTGLAVVKPTQATLLETGRLSLLNGIGQGAAGVVHKAVDNEGNFFAVKMLFKPRSEYSKKSVVRDAVFAGRSSCE